MKVLVACEESQTVCKALCPLYNNFSEMGSVCDVLLHIKDEKASRVKSIVEQWAKSHPVKNSPKRVLEDVP